MDLKSIIREVPDFPKPGIGFKDITTLIAHPQAMHQVTEEFLNRFKKVPVDAVMGIESRGFIFGAIIAYRLNVPFVPVRKPGKLPAETISASYELEYGTNVLHIHKDSLKAGQHVLIIDDLLATGGTLQAACALSGQLNAEVSGIGVVIELSFLKGRNKLLPHCVESLVVYDSE
jgi:adenine phosphoribosyltransferase